MLQCGVWCLEMSLAHAPLWPEPEATALATVNIRFGSGGIMLSAGLCQGKEKPAVKLRADARTKQLADLYTFVDRYANNDNILTIPFERNARHNNISAKRKRKAGFGNPDVRSHQPEGKSRPLISHPKQKGAGCRRGEVGRSFDGKHLAGRYRVRTRRWAYVARSI
eukprot:1192763-Prorocentrum_minimum.AAC.2